jgi:hypothetical protein
MSQSLRCWRWLAVRTRANAAPSPMRKRAIRIPTAAPIRWLDCNAISRFATLFCAAVKVRADPLDLGHRRSGAVGVLTVRERRTGTVGGGAVGRRPAGSSTFSLAASTRRSPIADSGSGAGFRRPDVRHGGLGGYQHPPELYPTEVGPGSRLPGSGRRAYRRQIPGFSACRRSRRYHLWRTPSAAELPPPGPRPDDVPLRAVRTTRCPTTPTALR